MLKLEKVSLHLMTLRLITGISASLEADVQVNIYTITGNAVCSLLLVFIPLLPFILNDPLL